MAPSPRRDCLWSRSLGDAPRGGRLDPRCDRIPQDAAGSVFADGSAVWGRTEAAQGTARCIGGEAQARRPLDPESYSVLMIGDRISPARESDRWWGDLGFDLIQRTIAGVDPVLAEAALVLPAMFLPHCGMGSALRPHLPHFPPIADSCLSEWPGTPLIGPTPVDSSPVPL